MQTYISLIYNYIFYIAKVAHQPSHHGALVQKQKRSYHGFERHLDR